MADVKAGKKIEPFAGIPVYYYSCTKCGFTFSTQFDEWTPEMFRQYVYNDNYIHHDPDYFSTRLKKNVFLLSQNFPEIAPGSILVYGAVPIDNAFQIRLQEAGFGDVTSTGPESYPSLAGKKFDTILAFDALEHHPEPRQLFENLVSLLNHDGAILFSARLADFPENSEASNKTLLLPRNGYVSLHTRESLSILASEFQLSLESFDSHDFYALFKPDRPAWANKYFPHDQPDAAREMLRGREIVTSDITLYEPIQAALRTAAEGHVSEAIRILDNLLETQPFNRDLHMDRGLLRMKSGAIADALDDMEYFYKGSMISQRGVFRDLKARASEFEGKLVVIVSDAGIGDLLWLVRYGVLLHEVGVRVVVECNPIFHSLFDNASWITHAAAVGDVPIPFLYRIPLHNLPGAFETRRETIPSFPHYLAASEEKIAYWKARLPASRKIRVGISWRSSNERTSGWASKRSMDLSMLLGAFDPEKYDCVVVQKDLNEAEREIIALHEWIHIPTGEINCIEDTAGLLSCMDLVVSTCTMIPHLSGALGIPTFLMLSTNASWVWMTEGETTPWYAAMKLFRQHTLGDWQPPVAHLGHALREFTRGN
ncbi:methyltransferase domain-containing protein [Paraburkholderia acidisoli]|uniref:Methyltransferase domain-containing protein n=1 Tax=Paraburkholderia acidisoli TaxID=2571748 RepID=A0A7Z2GFD8_9BURK|nr:methyltransferase domain-containing protein [Paraburkholderia acidisoli]QGZ60494.1 methyltransferase domain-containing protein [Paraburkholderia acidisoli]